MVVNGCFLLCTFCATPGPLNSISFLTLVPVLLPPGCGLKGYRMSPSGSDRSCCGRDWRGHKKTQGNKNWRPSGQCLCRQVKACLSGWGGERCIWTGKCSQHCQGSELRCVQGSLFHLFASLLAPFFSCVTLFCFPISPFLSLFCLPLPTTLPFSPSFSSSVSLLQLTFFFLLHRFVLGWICLFSPSQFIWPVLGTFFHSIPLCTAMCPCILMFPSFLLYLYPFVLITVAVFFTSGSHFPLSCSFITLSDPFAVSEPWYLLLYLSGPFPLVLHISVILYCSHCLCPSILLPVLFPFAVSLFFLVALACCLLLSFFFFFFPVPIALIQSYLSVSMFINVETDGFVQMWFYNGCRLFWS